MKLREGALRVATLIGFVLAVIGLFSVNAHFGSLEGEIQYGRWYEIEGNSNERYYLPAPSSQGPYSGLVDSLVGTRPEINKVSRPSYGANWTKRGWLIAAHLSSSGWHLFDTRAEAEAYLLGAGVEPVRIREYSTP